MTANPDVAREFIRRELPLMTTFLLKKIEIGDDDILQEWYEAAGIADMSEKFFRAFKVQPEGFTLTTYFPWSGPSFFSRNPINQDKKPLTIRMFIESAVAGHWLF